jgi:hypothetical protein
MSASPCHALFIPSILCLLFRLVAYVVNNKCSHGDFFPKRSGTVLTVVDLRCLSDLSDMTYMPVLLDR